MSGRECVKVAGLDCQWLCFRMANRRAFKRGERVSKVSSDPYSL